MIAMSCVSFIFSFLAKSITLLSENAQLFGHWLTIASDEKGLAISQPLANVVFGPSLFNESLPRPPGPAFPHSL